ncbi:hypothetical protein [Streptomyces solincola]|uniref:hypothetical protein n=1 Tax=Streptomyces solincola TaxID=2100817 RepID=UPI0015E3F1AF|nr:hypothetical protein [Streptomyces solincola]
MTDRTVDSILSQAITTWSRLGVDSTAAAEMVEELGADLSAAAFDGRDVGSYVGDDVEAFAASWAVERGLITPQPRLKETAVAAVKGAALPALAATALWFMGLAHMLDRSTYSFATTAGGGTRVEIHKYPDPSLPVMWFGLAVCAVAAFFTVRRAVDMELGRLLASGREATVRGLGKTLPLIFLVAALVPTAVSFVPPHMLDGYYVIIVSLPIGLISMIASIAGGAALVRHRTCPAVRTQLQHAETISSR